MRPAEVRGLKWDRVDLEAATLDISWQAQTLPYNIARDRSSGFRVPVGYTARHLVDSWHLTRPKTRSGKRVIPMVPWVVEVMRSWKAIAPSNPYGLVWSTPDGRPIDGKADRAAWAELLRAALGNAVEVPDLYDCRHTTVTMLLEAGNSPEVIIAIVGHSTFAPTKAYAHIRQEPAKSCAGRGRRPVRADERPDGDLCPHVAPALRAAIAEPPLDR
jgi:integrase